MQSGEEGLPEWYMGAALLIGFLSMMAMQAASEATTHGALTCISTIELAQDVAGLPRPSGR